MAKLFIILVTLFPVHPVHVSMSSLSGESENGELMLTVRIYTDDLALDLYRLYDAKGIYSEFDHLFVFTGSDTYYERYINEHLKVFYDGEVVETKLLGKEILDLETLLNFSVDIKDKPGGRINIENKILTGLYIDQVNLFILKVDTSEKAVKFTASKTMELFSGK